MKTYRVYHAEAAASPGPWRLEPDEAAHLAQVRRASDDDRIIVIDGAGRSWRAVIESAHKRAVVLAPVEELTHEATPGGRFVAAVPAMTKGGALDDVLRAAVELGIAAWLPVVSQRSVARPDADRAEHQRARWLRIAVEALKQCEGLWLPRLDEARSLDERVAQLLAQGCRPIVLAERHAAPPLVEVVGALSPAAGVALFVGPEGGWTDAEREALIGAGAVAASMGSRILRAETAMLAGLATVLAH